MTTLLLVTQLCVGQVSSTGLTTASGTVHIKINLMSRQMAYYNVRPIMTGIYAVTTKHWSTGVADADQQIQKFLIVGYPDPKKFHIALIDGNSHIFNKSPDTLVYRFPIGKSDRQIAAMVLNKSNKLLALRIY